ncbi:MAG: electron transporter [Armatimonadetes bacterium]|nr:MAG: electron transporter [Armatimonadota bacterium]
MEWIRQHKGITAVFVATAFAGIVFVLVWFQPQALFIDDVVNETLPQAAPTSQGEGPGDDGTEMGSSEAEDEDSAVTEPAPGEVAPEFPLTLSEGTFIDLAHAGTGTALVVELEDGTRILRLEDLDVDNGPDLRVILSTSSLVDDESAYDDGDFFDLGDLKGNVGNQNYNIPFQVDLDDYNTVAIWCRRFNVTFNAAPLSIPGDVPPSSISG